MMTNETTRLWEVLDYLRANGWYQGKYTDPNALGDTPPACLIGALDKVYMNGARHLFADGYAADFLALMRVIASEYPEVIKADRAPIPAFNDTKGRTFAEVERVVEKAAIYRDEVI